MRPADAYRLKYRSSSHNSMEPTETNETAEARVVDSADLMPRVLDFLGMGDAFTGNARAVVSKVWRGAAEKTKPRMSFHTFNGISASIHGPDDVWYDMSAPGEPKHIYSAKDLFRDDVRAAVSQRLKEEHPSCVPSTRSGAWHLLQEMQIQRPCQRLSSSVRITMTNL